MAAADWDPELRARVRIEVERRVATDAMRRQAAQLNWSVWWAEWCEQEDQELRRCYEIGDQDLYASVVNRMQGERRRVAFGLRDILENQEENAHGNA
jgi:hypothetical protein